MHIINESTGYCEVCKKIEFPKEKNNDYVPIGKIKDGSLGEQQIKKGTDTTDENQTKVLLYKRNICCDFCVSSLSKNYKFCEIWQALCYYPLWCVMLTTLSFMGGLGAFVYLTYDYVYTFQTFSSYTQTCSADLHCDDTKGLYCKLSLNNSGVNEESCSCPALGYVNTCDCASSHYWNGISCEPVLGYGEGPCSGDYSCYSSLKCDSISGTCLCSSLTPLWDSISLTCDYMYKGCWSYNPAGPQDFSNVSQIYIWSNTYTTIIELNDCLLTCQQYNQRYAHMFFSRSVNSCACSNSYNNFSTALNDATYCYFPCSATVVPGRNRCPTNLNNVYSSFQIGL